MEAATRNSHLLLGANFPESLLSKDAGLFTLLLKKHQFSTLDIKLLQKDYILWTTRLINTTKCPKASQCVIAKMYLGLLTFY